MIVTLFSLTDPKGHQPGTCLICSNQHEITSKNLLPELQHALEPEAANVHCYQQSNIKTYNMGDQEFTAFFSFIKPVVQLVIAGAGMMPSLARIAEIMGWKTVIADGRASHATRQRFPAVQTLLVTKPAQLLDQITIDEQTVFVLMTHNYNYYLELLKIAQRYRYAIYRGAWSKEKDAADAGRITGRSYGTRQRTTG